MRIFGFALLVFLASFVGCWVAAAVAAIGLGELAGISQAEGAYAMGAIFMIGPVAGLIGAAAITAFAVVRRRRKSEPAA